MNPNNQILNSPTSYRSFGATSKIVMPLVMLLCNLSIPNVAIADDKDLKQSDPFTDSISANKIPIPATWSLHGQFTNVTQFHPAFTAPYSGTYSMSPSKASNETSDLTLFLGIRLWPGSEIYINPEIDQGFGLSNTVGVAGFPSGAAYKVGQNKPYGRVHRAFLRQVIGLSGEEKKVKTGTNQLEGSVLTNNVTVTVGKFSVTDVFDTNTYAHDPRADFLNWSIVDGGAFDYAANAWGFTYGGSMEWTQSWWTVRAGFFDLSKVPNTTKLDNNFSQYEWVGELEARQAIFNHPGKVNLLGFVNSGYMGNYADAVHLAQLTGGTPDTSLVRHFASRPGFAINTEQEVTSDLGIFARASMNDGSKETFDFTDINRSVSAGLVLKGDRWGRHSDTVGLAFAINGISSDARGYFATGGIGVVIGDGKLNYGSEKLTEIYYSWQVEKNLTIGLDYQYIINPAFNRDRGPIPFLGLRVHMEL